MICRVSLAACQPHCYLIVFPSVHGVSASTFEMRDLRILSDLDVVGKACWIVGSGAGSDFLFLLWKRGCFVLALSLSLSLSACLNDIVCRISRKSWVFIGEDIEVATVGYLTMPLFLFMRLASLSGPGRLQWKVGLMSIILRCLINNEEVPRSSALPPAPIRAVDDFFYFE